MVAWKCKIQLQERKEPQIRKQQPQIRKCTLTNVLLVNVLCFLICGSFLFCGCVLHLHRNELKKIALKAVRAGLDGPVSHLYWKKQNNIL